MTKTLLLSASLLALGACYSPDVTRYEQSRFRATLSGRSEVVAYGRVAVDNLVFDEEMPRPEVLRMRVYLENPSDAPVLLDPAGVRLSDWNEGELERVSLLPTEADKDDLSIPAGTTRAFVLTFAFPEATEPLLAGFFLDWRLEQGEEAVEGRTRIVTDWIDHRDR